MQISWPHIFHAKRTKHKHKPTGWIFFSNSRIFQEILWVMKWDHKQIQFDFCSIFMVFDKAIHLWELFPKFSQCRPLWLSLICPHCLRLSWPFPWLAQYIQTPWSSSIHWDRTICLTVGCSAWMYHPQIHANFDMEQYSGPYYWRISWATWKVVTLEGC